MSETPLPLRDYQVKHLGFHIAEKKSLNTSHPGTGKTPTVCMFAYYHWAKFQKKTIWAMPQSLMEQNREKMIDFTGFATEDVVILTSDFRRKLKRDPADIPVKMRDKMVRRERRLKDGGLARGPDGNVLYERIAEPEEVVDLIAINASAKVFICTYAFLREHWAHLLTVIPEIDVYLVDEHHLGYKRPGSQQTDSYYEVHRRVNNSISMTGSLIDGQLDSVFTAIHAVCPEYYGSHVGFLCEHAGFVDDYGRVQEWINTDKVKTILQRHSAQITFKEAYGDEPMVHIHQIVEVNPVCLEEYEKFHEQAMLELEDGTILDGSLPGPATIRARQILSHPETFGIANGEETGKDQRIRIFAAEGQKMLLFASLIPEQERLVRVLTEEGLRVGLINANVSRSQRNRVDEAFKAGELDAVVASAATAGIGYDWPFLDHVIYVSPDYQDVNFIQGYRRGIRGTRDVALRVTTLEYRNTIDGRMYQIISQKSELAHSVDPTRPVLRFAA